MERLGPAIPQARDREVTVERAGASEIQSKIKPLKTNKRKPESERRIACSICHADSSRRSFNKELAKNGSAQIGLISLLANHAKKFFRALTRRTKSYETYPNFSAANSSIVTRGGFSLYAGSQKLSCGRSVGVTVNSTHHRVGH